jgi:SAM-dependent methyltransferase
MAQLTTAQEVVHSPYLVKRLLSGNDENLFNYVKFRLLANALAESDFVTPRILDLGCADKIAFRYLSNLGVDFEYCGVDYESPFTPDILADIRDPNQILPKLPWQPDVIMILDVLEHLEGQEADISQVLHSCYQLLAPGGMLLVTIPQMYRLDRFKFDHLYYEEHKIRLRQEEWYALLNQEFEVMRTQGLGFISVLPYLVMFSRQYSNQNWLGQTFRQLRGKTLEQPWLRSLDWQLSRNLGHHPWLNQWTNDVLFVCRRV